MPAIVLGYAAVHLFVDALCLYGVPAGLRAPSTISVLNDYNLQLTKTGRPALLTNTVRLRFAIKSR